jgi:uncharacterized membrane protein YcaP (DUF421 family)
VRGIEAAPPGYSPEVVVASTFFDGWNDLRELTVLGLVSYVALVLVLRVSGKRTLAKLNAFDLVVTVALGSTLATSLLSSEVSVSEGVAAFALLVGAQFVVSSASVRWRAVRRSAKSEPALLVEDGRLLDRRLRVNRIAVEEVRQAVRSSGLGGLEAVAAVVLETDGTLSVIPRSALGSGSALVDVRHSTPMEGGAHGGREAER